VSAPEAAAGTPPGRPFPLAFAALVLLCLVAITSICGFLLGLPEMRGLALASGVAAVAIVALQGLRAERDWLCPIFLLAATAAVRIGIPAVLVARSGPPRHFHMFHLREQDWTHGWMLALLGLVSISLGWLVLPRATALLGRTSAAFLDRGFRIDRRSFVVSACCVLLGAAFLVAFLRMNYSSGLDALGSGTIRKGERVAGTSRYAFLAVSLLIYGTLLTSAWLLLVRRVRWLPGLLPALAVTAVISSFGGRVLAIAPLAFAGILLWYRADRSRLGYARVLVAVVGVVSVFALYSVFLTLYRNGLGLAAAKVAVSSEGLSRYRQATLWYEGGALHNYALAAHFPPGVLHGGSVPLVVGLVGTVAGLTGVRPGRFLVVSFIGDLPGRKWEFHSGVVVDLYLNFGLVAVVAGGVLFGLLLRTCYRGMRAYRHSPVVMAFYTVLLWRLFWMFYEHTIAALDIVFVVFPLMMAMLFAARLIPAPGAARAPLLAPPRPLPPAPAAG